MRGKLYIRYMEIDTRCTVIDMMIDMRYTTIDIHYTVIDTHYTVINTTIDTRYMVIDTRYTAIDIHYTAIDTRYTVIDTTIDTRYMVIDTRYTAIDTRYTAIDTMIDTVTWRLTPVTRRLTPIDAKKSKKKRGRIVARARAPVRAYHEPKFWGGGVQSKKNFKKIFPAKNFKFLKKLQENFYKLWIFSKKFSKNFFWKNP